MTNGTTQFAGLRFMRLGMVALATGMLFGIIGGIYFYLPGQCNLPLFSGRAANWHFWIFLVTGLAIIGCYLSGRFGGREYFEFPPILSLPIFLTWVLFGVSYFKTVLQDKKP